MWNGKCDDTIEEDFEILSASWQEFNEFMSAYSDKPYMTNIKLKQVEGPSIKYVTLQRGEGVWESVTVCDRGEGGKDHVTSHFPFFHNSQFYVLFYLLYFIIFSQFTILRFILYFIMHNTNLSCNYHLRNCKKLNL